MRHVFRAWVLDGDGREVASATVNVTGQTVHYAPLQLPLQDSRDARFPWVLAVAEIREAE